MNNLIKKLENQFSRIQCTNCKRVLEFTDNDEYRCKYGLTSVENDERPKCKYFKRHSKYITYNGLGKIRTKYIDGHDTKINYVRGKFHFDKIKQ